MYVFDLEKRREKGEDQVQRQQVKKKRRSGRHGLQVLFLLPLRRQWEPVTATVTGTATLLASRSSARLE